MLLCHSGVGRFSDFISTNLASGFMSCYKAIGNGRTVGHCFNLARKVGKSIKVRFIVRVIVPILWGRTL